ncbi:MAG: hypothetical protein ABR581_01225 [Thermoleophilaceae bacterium]
MRLLIAAGIALLAIAGAGCGTDNSSQAVRHTVQGFYAGLQRHDGAAACRELSDDARSSLESQEKKPCDQAVLSLGLSSSPIGPVQVYVTDARANLTGGEAVFLDQTPQGWKISAAGCKPKHEKPYDCELQA